MGGERRPDEAPEMSAWAAELRAAEAARERARRRSLGRQLAEEATWAGVLVDLCERGEPVVVSAAAGRVHRGTLVSVGRDFCAVADGRGGVVAIAFSAIGRVRAGAGAGAVGGATSVAGGREADDVLLADVLAGLAERRAAVSVATVDGEVTTGELLSAGRDVLALAAPPGGGGSLVYVRLASTSDVSWRESG